MINLKNITELPMAESADGLNLIVNDNGAAKQIAASAVSVQADWNQNDSTKPDYVKNRPFYETEDGEVHKIPERYFPDGIGGGSYDFVGAAYSNQRFEILSGGYEAVKAKLESGIVPNIIVVRTYNEDVPLDIYAMALADGFYIYRAFRIALYADHIWCEMDDRQTGLSINADGTMFFGSYD